MSTRKRRATDQSMKLRRRQSDARWRANVANCYETLKHIIPVNKRASKRQISKAMILQETHKHIDFLENILSSLLTEKANIDGERDPEEYCRSRTEDIKSEFLEKERLRLHSQDEERKQRRSKSTKPSESDVPLPGNADQDAACPSTHRQTNRKSNARAKAKNRPAPVATEPLQPMRMNRAPEAAPYRQRLSHDMAGVTDTGQPPPRGAGTSSQDAIGQQPGFFSVALSNAAARAMEDKENSTRIVTIKTAYPKTATHGQQKQSKGQRNILPKQAHNNTGMLSVPLSVPVQSPAPLTAASTAVPAGHALRTCTQYYCLPQDHRMSGKVLNLSEQCDHGLVPKSQAVPLNNAAVSSIGHPSRETHVQQTSGFTPVKLPPSSHDRTPGKVTGHENQNHFGTPHSMHDYHTEGTSGFTPVKLAPSLHDRTPGKVTMGTGFDDMGHIGSPQTTHDCHFLTDNDPTLASADLLCDEMMWASDDEAKEEAGVTSIFRDAARNTSQITPATSDCCGAEYLTGKTRTKKRKRMEAEHEDTRVISNGLDSDSDICFPDIKEKEMSLPLMVSDFDGYMMFYKQTLQKLQAESNTASVYSSQNSSQGSSSGLPASLSTDAGNVPFSSPSLDLSWGTDCMPLDRLSCSGDQSTCNSSNLSDQLSDTIYQMWKEMGPEQKQTMVQLAIAESSCSENIASSQELSEDLLMLDVQPLRDRDDSLPTPQTTRENAHTNQDPGIFLPFSDIKEDPGNGLEPISSVKNEELPDYAEQWIDTFDMDLGASEEHGPSTEYEPIKTEQVEQEDRKFQVLQEIQLKPDPQKGAAVPSQIIKIIPVNVQRIKTEQTSVIVKTEDGQVILEQGLVKRPILILGKDVYITE